MSPENQKHLHDTKSGICLNIDKLTISLADLDAAFDAVRAEERSRAVEVVKPFAAIFAEHDEDLPPNEDRHAWGFNGSDLYWRDFRRAAAYIADNQGEA